MRKTVSEYMKLSYRMEIVEDKAEGGFVISYPDLSGIEIREPDSSSWEFRVVCIEHLMWQHSGNRKSVSQAKRFEEAEREDWKVIVTIRNAGRGGCCALYFSSKQSLEVVQ